MGLHPGSQYRVGVAAYTVEIGPASEYTDFVTMEEGKQGNGFQGDTLNTRNVHVAS